MANITSIEPIRYTQDEVITSIEGLFKLKDTASIDLTSYDAVTGITVESIPEQLPSSVECRFVFKATGQGNWFKLTSAGSSEEIETQDITSESVLEEGNTISELRALSDVPVLAGKNIVYACALKSLDPDNMKPQVRLKFQCKSGSQQLVKTEYSPIYEYENGVIMSNVEANAEAAPGGSVTVQAQYTVITDDGFEESVDWTSLNTLNGRKVRRVQFRAVMSVSQPGQGTVQLNSVRFSYRSSDSISTSGLNEIVSVVRDWRRELRHCRVNIKHSPADTGTLKAYATFRGKPKKVTGELLGYGQGVRAVYPFEYTEGINLSTVQVYVSGVPATGYDVNCEAGHVIIDASNNAPITCDYEYGWSSEEWLELEHDYTEKFEGYDMSVYRLTLPENVLSGNEEDVKSMAGIKITMSAISGHEDDEVLGTGWGYMAEYKLTRAVSNGGIVIKSNGVQISNLDYELEEDTRYVRITGRLGETLSASYDWESESPVVYEFGGVFSL